jgi:hypothetical protein
MPMSRVWQGGDGPVSFEYQYAQLLRVQWKLTAALVMWQLGLRFQYKDSIHAKRSKMMNLNVLLQQGMY